MSGISAFTMPKWGIEMTEGRVAEWFVAEGAPYAKGTLLAAIEGDKITNEVEAEAPGRFARIIAQAGETYPVGALLAVIAGPEIEAARIDAFIASFKRPGTLEDLDAEAPTVAAAPAIEVPADANISPAARRRAIQARVNVSALQGSGRQGRITAQDVDQAAKPASAPRYKGVVAGGPAETRAFASPMAVRLAHLHGVTLEGVAGTGPRGRIGKADVLALVAPATAEAPTEAPEVIVMSPARKATARRLVEAKTTIPHFYLRRRARVQKLFARREAEGKIASINDYFIRACALALMQVRDVNVQVHDGAIHRFPHADVAIAVATDKGLMTPVIKAADTLSVAQIAGASKRLIERARAGKLALEEISGGSFTLSNLGGFGVEQFDAIINPPHGAILAVGAARPEPMDEGGTVRLALVVHLSLSCDHRAIDGAFGARFLAVLVDLIETPERL